MMGRKVVETNLKHKRITAINLKRYKAVILPKIITIHFVYEIIRRVAPESESNVK